MQDKQESALHRGVEKRPFLNGYRFRGGWKALASHDRAPASRPAPGHHDLAGPGPRPRAAGRSWGSRAAPGAYRLGQRARPGLTFPEVPSPSTTIFSCRSWLSSSESDMLSREPGLPPPTPRGRGRKGRRRGPGPGKGGRAAVGAEPPARVPEPPPEKSAQITRRAPSCPPCRPLPSLGAATPPSRDVGRAPPASAPTCAFRAPRPGRPIRGPGRGETFEASRPDAALPTQGQ